MRTNMQVNVKNLISWRAISMLLAGNEGSIRGEVCPKKYKEAITSLEDSLEDWAKVYVSGHQRTAVFTEEEIKNNLNSISWKK